MDIDVLHHAGNCHRRICSLQAANMPAPITCHCETAAHVPELYRTQTTKQRVAVGKLESLGTCLGAGEASTTCLAQFGAFLSTYLNGETGLALNDFLVQPHLFSPPLAPFNRTTISQAIKEIAEESATDIATRIVPKLYEKLGVVPIVEEPAWPLYEDDIVKYIYWNLANFYNEDEDHEVVANCVSLVDGNAEKLATEFRVYKDVVPRLAQIGLCDFIILCGTSPCPFFHRYREQFRS